jgi:hypothetical protein
MMWNVYEERMLIITVKDKKIGHKLPLEFEINLNFSVLLLNYTEWVSILEMKLAMQMRMQVFNMPHNNAVNP